MFRAWRALNSTEGEHGARSHINGSLARFSKPKLAHSKGRHSTLKQARDARGRRASRLKVHTSYHTELHDLCTPQRGYPSERVITPLTIVPPSTSRSPGKQSDAGKRSEQFPIPWKAHWIPAVEPHRTEAFALPPSLSCTLDWGRQKRKKRAPH